ncbi:MAG: hypothetical protein ACREXS_13045 [Gammaproteobacteria bacterium]
MVAHGRLALKWAARQAMANVTLKGNPIHTVGELPKVGSPH